ncbi:MAG: U32 family peptidase [Muribaculaceae bacterium]|nr:U32 family peptidase [Muribaculaceae bacterium]
MKRKKQRIELLAPAKDASVAIEAVNHGADAVYMGASRFGARALAGNSVSDIARVCEVAHHFDARVYVTVNTLVYDHELAEVERLIGKLYRADVDALIVQDLGILRLDIPPIALHASTQCDLRTPQKAKFLEALGFSQLVMARELTLYEIAKIRKEVKVPLEAFVHGALCVSYSGRCQASQAFKQRSANRGECAQLCRLPYDLLDENGRAVMKGKHLLSLRDLNQSSRLEAMMNAGVSSFKIEGRLKEASYVKNVVAHYRKLMDEVIARNAERYERSSYGRSSCAFVPDVMKSFNRSFTHYFLDERHPANGNKMASIDTPKSMGEPLGRVTAVRGNRMRIDTSIPLANGDGLSFKAPDGTFAGVRVNVADGSEITLRQAVDIKKGAFVYRTFDKRMEEQLANSSPQRAIDVEAALRRAGDRLVLDLTDERGCHVTHSVQTDALAEASTPQGDRQQDVLGKLGGTGYRLCGATVLDDLFVPSSVLANLRRETIALLNRAHHLARARDYRKKENKNALCPMRSLESVDNVANHLARRVYQEHGVEGYIPMAMECEPPEKQMKENAVVMHTRYCLRRELGACLKEKNAAHKLPVPLFLRHGNVLMRVDCDCRKCEMKLRLT